MAEQITVRYRAQLADITGSAGELMTAATIKDVLSSIKKRYGQAAEKQAKAMLIVVNGESILQLKHYNTALCPGDEISFLPVCGGG